MFATFIIKMSMFFKKNLSYIFLAVFCITLIVTPFSNVIAQCNTESPFYSESGNPNPCCIVAGACGDCPLCVEAPLDGGLTFLLIAGIAFGLKKALFSK